jgi:ribosomal protein S18 acetylase RimI-like enzyme
MKLKQLLEAPIAGQPVYHATSLEFIKSILDTNTLRADTHHNEHEIYPELKQKAINSSKTIQGVSLTRDKNFAEEWADVVLVLDLNRIKQNLKVKQVAYFADDTANNREESEEFVIGSIKNLNRYLIGIYFPKRLQKEYLDWKWVQKNIKPVPVEFEGWKAVLENPKYIGQPIMNARARAVGESSILVENSRGKILWQDGDLCVRNNKPDTVTLFDKKVGAIGTLAFEIEDTDHGSYYSVQSVFIDKKYRQKGYAKLLYTTLLKNLPNNISGIASDLNNREDNVAIPKIYKDLGGYEKDGVAYIDKKKSINEQGRIIPGVNTPPGITADHTKLMAAKLGFNVSRDGRPPLMPTNGKINTVPQKDPDHKADDEKSLFGVKLDLTKWTNGKSKDNNA